MIKKIIKHFWYHRYQLAKYTAIGGSGFVLDMITLIALKEGLGINPVLAVIVNQLFMINYVFFLNKYWTFRSKGITREQMLRFWMLMMWNYSFAIVIMWVGNVLLDINYIYVRILSIAVTVTWNFILYKHWVFIDGGVCIKNLFKHFLSFLKIKD